MLVFVMEATAMTMTPFLAFLVFFGGLTLLLIVLAVLINGTFFD
jgi:hypothetical protein